MPPAFTVRTGPAIGAMIAALFGAVWLVAWHLIYYGPTPRRPAPDCRGGHHPRPLRAPPASQAAGFVVSIRRAAVTPEQWPRLHHREHRSVGRDLRSCRGAEQLGPPGVGWRRGDPHRLTPLLPPRRHLQLPTFLFDRHSAGGVVGRLSVALPCRPCEPGRLPRSGGDGVRSCIVHLPRRGKNGTVCVENSLIRCSGRHKVLPCPDLFESSSQAHCITSRLAGTGASRSSSMKRTESASFKCSPTYASGFDGRVMRIA